MGDDSVIEVHLIVPTQFGLRHTATRDAFKHALITGKTKDTALFYQQTCLNTCALCSTPLRHNPLPFQMALRLVAAEEEESFRYDIQMCMLCRKCQTSKPSSLVIVTERLHQGFENILAKYAFAERLNTEQPLLQQCLERIQILNENCAAVMHYLLPECAHCGSVINPRLRCPNCDAVSFCASTCMQEASYYHDVPHTDHILLEADEFHACPALSNGDLFHTGLTYYVTRDGTTERCLYQEEMKD